MATQLSIPLTNIFFKLHSSNTIFLGREQVLAASRSASPIVPGRGLSPSQCSPRFLPSPNCCYMVQKSLFTSHHRDNSYLCVPDFDKHSISPNDTMVLSRQFQLVYFQLIVSDLYMLRTQDNILTSSNKYNEQFSIL